MAFMQQKQCPTGSMALQSYQHQSYSEGVIHSKPYSDSEEVRTASNATLARGHLSASNYLLNFIFDGECTRKKKIALSNAASIAARQQSEYAGPRLFG